ncbi:gustatory receptor 10a-like [Haematobia irritans]|uniref:gustatory receptor 10a-like n=1 Tax=Haematobia irritans TaxID=7368 RepID=UPI003F503F79
MQRKSSVWEKHKTKFYIFGNIYATLHGLIVIDYFPTKTTKPIIYYLATAYCHFLSSAIIVFLPMYFVWNLQYLVETKDPRWKLQLLVNFSNTFIKYCMVVITYIANFIHYKDIRYVMKRRESLEEELNHLCRDCDEEPRTKFEFMLLFKFSTINAMLLIQIAQILYQYIMGANAVRIYFQLYTFFLWNYTENMADYFYYINCSSLKFLRQLQQQMHNILNENRNCAIYRKYKRNTGGLTGQYCCILSDRLHYLVHLYGQICYLYKDSVRMHQFQILGLILTTLISNLTNLFTLFNLLSKQSTFGPTEIVLNCIFAIAFYIDTYIVTLTSDKINMEMEILRIKVQEFSEIATLDWRLEETVRFRYC